VFGLLPDDLICFVRVAHGNMQYKMPPDRADAAAPAGTHFAICANATLEQLTA
jgi:hypothetical protein